MDQVVLLLVQRSVEFGIGGIAIGWLVWSLIQSKKELSERNERIAKLYDDRLALTTDMIKRLSENTVVNDKLSQAISLFSEKTSQNFNIVTQNQSKLDRIIERLDRVNKV